MLYIIPFIIIQIPGQSILDKSILGIFVLIFMGVIAYIYKQSLESNKEQKAQHQAQLDMMIKKLDESEIDRDDIYNNYLEHFKTSEQSLLQIISKNTEVFSIFNSTAIKLISIIDLKFKL